MAKNGHGEKLLVNVCKRGSRVRLNTFQRDNELMDEVMDFSVTITTTPVEVTTPTTTTTTKKLVPNGRIIDVV